MFGIAPDEMLLVVIVAIIAIGPKDLPLALRTAGRWIGQIRRVSGHFRSGIETMIREAEMEEMERKWKEQNAAIMAAHPQSDPGPDPAAGQSAEATTDQNDPPPLMQPLPAPVDPEVAAVAPTEPQAEPIGEMLPISQRPERPRGGRGMMVSDIDETQAPLLEHLLELRTRLLRCVYALAIAFAVCFFFAQQILDILVHPLALAFPQGQGKLIYTKLYSAFFVDLKVSLFAAFLVSFPVIANQLWAFIAPGLYAREKKAFLPFLIATPILFSAGASLAYFVVMPTAFRWFISFQGTRGGLQLEALPGIEEYLNLVMQFIFAFGVSFLLPVLLMLLNRAGIVSRAQLVAARRYVIVGITALAAVITPPDVLSQLMLAIPLMILFEGTLIVMRFAEKKDAEERAKAEAAGSGT